MIHNILHFHKPFPSSHSNLGEVASTAEREANRPVMHGPTHTDERLSHAKLELVEVVSTATESGAVRSLAARIPPELFENILFYVNVDRVSQREEVFRTNGKYLARNRGQPSPIDVLTDLKQCSLVCLFWANKCREHMFSGRTLKIQSYQDAEIFRRYVVGGCPRLMPVHRLIKWIWVTQYHESRRSFLHLLYLPAIHSKLEWFSIEGPIPDGFNHAKLDRVDTPHWGIPPSVVVPSSFLQNNIFVRDVHLASFHHVVKYTRHLTCATWIQFAKITWDGQTPTYSLPQASNKINCQRRPRSLRIEVLGVCTNSLHLALTALMMNPNCPLHRLSDEERVWMIKFMTLLWGDKPDPDVRIGFNISEQATTMRLYPFHFVFEETSAYTDRSASALSVMGMHAYIYNSDFFPANFDALVDHARTHPTIRALVLLFHTINYLQETMKPFVEVLALATGTIELVLAYEEKERKAVGVDLATLEPNDCLWADLREGRYGQDKGLEILQQQLKKKRWMSLH